MTDKERLSEILASHAKWLKNKTEGERANLSETGPRDLSGMDLSGVVPIPHELLRRDLC
jgi:hypothetical protein